MSRIVDLWRRWADGDPVSNSELDGMVDELASLGRRGDYACQFRALGEALADWAGAVGTELRTPPRLTRCRARGPELGL